MSKHFGRIAAALCVAVMCIVPTMTVTGCAALVKDQGVVTQEQQDSLSREFYRAHALYNAALGVAVAYAESPGADRAVVAKITSINRKASTAIRVVESYLTGQHGDLTTARGNLTILIAATGELTSLLTSNGVKIPT